MSKFRYNYKEYNYDINIIFKNKENLLITRCDYIELIIIDRILFIRSRKEEYHIKYDDILYYNVYIREDVINELD